MMGSASADFTDGTARTSIIRHSLMPMLPSESSICHTNLGTTVYILGMFHILEWLLIDACNNEDYAKIWTRPHLDTLYFAHDAYRVLAGLPGFARDSCIFSRQILYFLQC